ncbi:MAG: hypothetical protein KJP16_00070 [Gammaproteobacteria bacterium]|nr:hypothetical protein [Gammaproteobacteria bacterium]NNL49179.1 hypothetical protein [Woeseiaceae bacterium]
MNQAKNMALIILAFFVVSACGNGSVEEQAVAADETQAVEAPEATAKPQSTFDGTVAKPGSPFSVSYKVIGTPIVGSPVTVELRVTSTLGSQPVTVSYRLNDASAMLFHEAQPSRIEIAPAANEDFITQRVTVVPQREGRMYLNVATSVETENGSMSSVMAVPIQVGTGGRELEENGEVQLDENDEAVRVLTVE